MTTRLTMVSVLTTCVTLGGSFALSDTMAMASSHALSTLRLGSHDRAVQTLQEELHKLGYFDAADGYSTWYGSYTEGAVMTYEAEHQLPVDGIATPLIQRQIQSDILHHRENPLGAPYHIIVKEDIPERLYLYHGDTLVMTSLANTGIAGGRTPIGSFPVYSKFVSQTMRGYNPNGTYYDDPGIPWILYFYPGGYAVHGYVRRHYGFPESAGCVELPPATAKVVFSRVPVGSIVTVVSGPAV